MAGPAKAWAQHREVLPEYHLGPGASAVAVFNVCGLIWLLFVGLLLARVIRQRRNAARAEASYANQGMLVPGETVLQGTVELAAGSDVAVKVEVRQHGTESESSGSWSYRWEERDREVHIAPFYLRYATGERIRVEPPDDVLLVDDMDGKILVDRNTRIRFAELVPGEAVFARGELVRASDPEAGARYRDEGRAWVLRRPRNARMLLSSRPLGERFVLRARFHRRWAVAMILAVAFLQAFAVPYHARLFAGRTVDGVVVDLRHTVTEDSDGDPVNHYTVYAIRANGRVVEDEVGHATFVSLDKQDHVPLRIVPGWPGHERIGATASIHAALIGFPPVAFVVLLLVYRYRRKRTRAWFENQVIDTGSGRLPGV